jgi:LAO/AO transport system kinase
VALELTGKEKLLHSALEGSRRDLSRLLSMIEKGEELSMPEGEENPDYMILGITGPPGVGKSTLVGRIISYWKDRGKKVAVLAIDPSSPRTGGACCGWEKIIIETVGSGQSEIKIVAFADKIVLVDGPDRGDIIQAEKAGIIELADLVVVNKSDVPSALKVAENIRSAFSFSNVNDSPEVLLVSAERNDGIEEMMELIQSSESPLWRSRIKIRERLLSLWDHRLMSSPNLNQVIDDIETGSISLEDGLDILSG